VWLGALVMILGYATFEYGSASKDLIANNVISHQSMILSVRIFAAAIGAGLAAVKLEA